MEANYDDGMLLRGRYPFHLKNRIRGGKGHLSNAQALQVFLTHRPNFLSHLFLAHLSKDNNSPELVQQLFNEHAQNTRIVIASRDKETGVFEIDHQPKSNKKSRFLSGKRSITAFVVLTSKLILIFVFFVRWKWLQVWIIAYIFWCEPI